MRLHIHPANQCCDILEISLSHSESLLSHSYRFQPPAESLLLIGGVHARRGEQGRCGWAWG
jgi:hypothetical protein